jgi:hypothetical protein
MEIYVPGTDGDAPLLQWYGQLVEAGDIANLLGPSLHPLGAFMRHYTDPTSLVLFDEDDHGWTVVALLTTFMGGGTWGLWVRKDLRGAGSRRALSFIMDSLAYAFTLVPVLVNTTRQPEVVAKTERLGYKYLGAIPLLFEGEDCHILYMTREMFQPVQQQWDDYKVKRHEPR